MKTQEEKINESTTRVFKAVFPNTTNHYDTLFSLGLTDSEKADLVEYLKSLGEGPTTGMNKE